MSNLSDLIETALLSDEPGLISSGLPRPGGVDPLGLRQINFDLMDKIFSGINNVARHIRPFTVVTWAWHRAAAIADHQGHARIPVTVLRDFVDRIEVIFAWSQFARDPLCILPGRDVLSSLLQKLEYEFGGAEWERRKTARVNSTALSAPINYGPALKAFGWLQTDSSGALVPTPASAKAVEAMDVVLEPFKGHPAFSSLGKVIVTRSDIDKWADAWALDQPTEAEKQTMIETLAGEFAPTYRRDGVALTIAAMTTLEAESSEQTLRQAMCGVPTDFRPPAPLANTCHAWRVMQNRQAFRLALEAMFFWICERLNTKPARTSTLVREFISEAGDAETAGGWLAAVQTDGLGPADWIANLERCMNESNYWAELPATIRGALAACIAEASDNAGTERVDRLPLARAAREARGWSNHPVSDFLAHVIGSWVLGQHVYWSVGRGLADARAGGRTILRLKVSLEDEGWTKTPGAL